MKDNTTLMLKILYVLSWVIFVGLCIQAGGFIFNSFFTLVLNPVGARHFWQEVDLSGLYRYDPGYFFVVTMIMSIVAIAKAYLFYLIIQVLGGKKLNMSQPFSHPVGKLIFMMSYMAFLIGIFSFWGVAHYVWLLKKGVMLPDLQTLHFGGGDVWLFMGVTLYVIAQIFKKGIELQTENELTV